MAKKYICLQPSLVVWFLWYRFHSTRYTAQPESESAENIKFGTGEGIVSGGQKREEAMRIAYLNRDE